jgi:RNA recognition motif-containing protein
MNIYVGNISHGSSEDEIRSAFVTYGEVESVRLITDRETGRSKGFGFVEMPKNDQAQAAIAGLNGTELGGRKLTVNEARPREKREGGGAGGGDRFRSGSGGRPGGGNRRY